LAHSLVRSLSLDLHRLPPAKSLVAEKSLLRPNKAKHEFVRAAKGQSDDFISVSAVDIADLRPRRSGSWKTPFRGRARAASKRPKRKS
jgi:hypothetical protein